MLKNNENINYVGSVTVKEFCGDRLINTFRAHNAGTKWLFYVLANALVGSHDALQHMPHFFDMGYKLDDGTFRSILSTRIGLTSKVIDGFNESQYKNGKATLTTYGYSAVFTATIPAANIVGTGAVTCYQLTSSSKDSGGVDSTVLAEVNVPANNEGYQYKQVAGYTYVVEWIMTFANEKTEDVYE